MSADKFLTRNKTSLQDILMEDPQLILNKCHGKELITRREYLNLKNINKGTESDCIISLVDKIMGKGEERCKEFLALLQTDKAVNDTFPELKKLLGNDTASLPKPVQGSTSTAQTGDVAQDNQPKPDKEQYPLKSKPTGLCFIINNVNFKDDEPRYGSDADAESLAKVFSWLGFRVLMCKDQTKDEMGRVLKCLSSATDISNLSGFKVKEWSDSKFTDLQEVPAHGDAFICCILTHGDIGVVFGTDGERLSIKDIKKTFIAADSPPLTDKPKVFLIQACQGREPHGAVALPNVQPDQLASIPKEADFLVGMATVEGYESYRDPERGSWYMQSVCKHLWEECPRGVDMYKILTCVNKEVSLKDGRMVAWPRVTLKQMPEIRSSLRNDLVFSPPPN